MTTIRQPGLCTVKMLGKVLTEEKMPSFLPLKPQFYQTIFVYKYAFMFANTNHNLVFISH